MIILEPEPPNSLRWSSRFTVTNLRGHRPLLMDVSNETAFAEGRTWDDLPPHRYHHLDNDIGIRVRPQVDIRIGPSRIPGAGLGLFIDAGPATIHEGSVIGEFCGEKYSIVMTSSHGYGYHILRSPGRGSNE